VSYFLTDSLKINNSYSILDFSLSFIELAVFQKVLRLRNEGWNKSDFVFFHFFERFVGVGGNISKLYFKNPKKKKFRKQQKDLFFITSSSRSLDKFEIAIVYKLFLHLSLSILKKKSKTPFLLCFPFRRPRLLVNTNLSKTT